MEALREFFGWVGQVILGPLGYMLDHIFTDSSYRAGFFACLLFLVLAGLGSSAFVWAWNRILAFFSAPQAPLPPPQQSPAQATAGCGGGCLLVLIAALTALGVMWGISGA